MYVLNFIPQLLTSNLKAEFTVLDNHWRNYGGMGLGGPKPLPHNFERL